MNTPSHVVASLLVLGRRERPRDVAPLTLGALLPDLPMIAFYLVERGLLGTSERMLWTRAYYEPGWQAFFDLFNSLPLVALGLGLAGWRRARGPVLHFASMAVHILFDLPLHHDDAHRHFFPLSDWRFASPISYWDPRHYGDWIAPLELAGVLVGAAVLWRRHRERGPRLLVAGLLAATAGYVAFALVMWAG